MSDNFTIFTNISLLPLIITGSFFVGRKSIGLIQQKTSVQTYRISFDRRWDSETSWYQDSSWNSFHVGEREREREYLWHQLHSSLLSYLVFHIFPQGGFKVMSTCRWSRTFLWNVTYHLPPPSSHTATLYNDKYNHWEKSWGQCCCWLLVSCYCLSRGEISCCR